MSIVGIWTLQYRIRHLRFEIAVCEVNWQFGIESCRVIWIDLLEKGRLQLKVTAVKKKNVKKKNQRQQKIWKTRAPGSVMKRKQEDRSFRTEWKKTFAWLQFNEIRQEMFCTACREFPSLADKESSFFTESQAFHIGNIKAHASNRRHARSMCFRRTAEGAAGKRFTKRCSIFATNVKRH